MLLLLVVALVRLCLTALAALHQAGRVAAMRGLAMVAGAPLSSLAPPNLIIGKMILIINSRIPVLLDALVVCTDENQKHSDSGCILNGAMSVVPDKS